MRGSIDRLFSGAVVLVLTLFSGLASADWALNMTQGVTPYSQEVYGLHMIMLWICVIIGIGVFGAMFYAILRFRKSKGAVADTWHEDARVEVVWTLVPFLILVAIAFPATRALIMMEDTSGSDLTIKVTGYQWKWSYDYVDEDVTVYSTLAANSNAARQLDSGINPADVPHYLLDVDQEIVVPTNTKIRFLTTAADVIHAWWVPDLGWKRDAIPGFINESWALIEEEGTYRGQCAELCGKDHGFMPIVVRAVSPEAFEQWLTEQRADKVAERTAEARDWSLADLIKHGEQVYNDNCTSCHQAGGEGIPGMVPALATSEVLAGPVSAHAEVILNGRADTQMRSFAADLSNADIAAVVAYKRAKWGSADALLQPAEVALLRNTGSLADAR
jgi:cytochrome c oxidase subunit 2